MKSENHPFCTYLWRVSLVTFLAIFGAKISNCQEKPVDVYPNSNQGANALLLEFLKPGADLAALTKKLEPIEKDYSTVFKPEYAKKMAEMYAQPWKDGLIVLSPKLGQSEVLLYSATSEELQKWTGNAKEYFPGGYEKIGPGFADGLTVYRFKFVSPGEKMGMAFDGLIYVNGHWRLFPKPYRVLEEPKPKS
jgi:hypothetical protein